jgi:hypothetical protein
LSASPPCSSTNCCMNVLRSKELPASQLNNVKSLKTQTSTVWVSKMSFKKGFLWSTGCLGGLYLPTLVHISWRAVTGILPCSQKPSNPIYQTPLLLAISLCQQSGLKHWLLKEKYKSNYKLKDKSEILEKLHIYVTSVLALIWGLSDIGRHSMILRRRICGAAVWQVR